MRQWRSTNGGHPIIILHACATSDFAKEMSNDEEFNCNKHILRQLLIIIPSYGWDLTDIIKHPLISR